MDHKRLYFRRHVRKVCRLHHRVIVCVTGFYKGFNTGVVDRIVVALSGFITGAANQNVVFSGLTQVQ